MTMGGGLFLGEGSVNFEYRHYDFLIFLLQMTTQWCDAKSQLH